MQSDPTVVKPAKILVVDDKPANLLALEAVLDSEAYELIFARSGTEALALLKEHEDIALILLDVQMPRIDGYEVAKRIKATPEYGDIPIVFITAVHTDDPFIIRGYEAGAVDYFSKPFDPKILRMKVAIYASFRQKTELLKEQERYRVTLDSIGDAVMATDVRANVTFINAVAEALTGWTAREAIGQHITSVFKIVREGTQIPIINPVSEVLRIGSKLGLANHTSLIARDGKQRPIADSAAPIRLKNGELVGVVLVFRDVTEERAAELADRRLRAIVDGSDDAIIGKNLQGIVTDWNRGAERLFGYTAAEMINHPLTKIFPADRLYEEAQILARMQRGEKVNHFETVRIRKDRTKVNVSVTISPIRGSDGTIIGVSKIAREVPASRVAEMRLTQ